MQLKTSVWCFLYLILNMVSFEGISQNNFPASKVDFMSGNNLVYKVISFGEKIDFRNVENTANWAIINTTEKRIVNFSGNQINDFIFGKLGIYERRFFENKVNRRGVQSSSVSRKNDC